MKFVNVVGARPHFPKAAVVSRVLRNRGHAEILVHTGQHYDDLMSDVFFRQLGLPSDVNLMLVPVAAARQRACSKASKPCSSSSVLTSSWSTAIRIRR
jgi:UDP-N-acetylglucosamine 2-epimerase